MGCWYLLHLLIRWWTISCFWQVSHVVGGWQEKRNCWENTASPRRKRFVVFFRKCNSQIVPMVLFSPLHHLWCYIICQLKGTIRSTITLRLKARCNAWGRQKERIGFLVSCGRINSGFPETTLVRGEKVSSFKKPYETFSDNFLMYLAHHIS